MYLIIIIIFAAVLCVIGPISGRLLIVVVLFTLFAFLTVFLAILFTFLLARLVLFVLVFVLVLLHGTSFLSLVDKLFKLFIVTAIHCPISGRLCSFIALFTALLAFLTTLLARLVLRTSFEAV